MNNLNNKTVDLLQIKIEQAKNKLPTETLNAIAAVDWKAAILQLREKKGYNFEQLGDLEQETELVLCGLSDPIDYPKELQTRMRISKADTDELVNEMNIQVFEKIKAELIKNSERKKTFQNTHISEPAINGTSIAHMPLYTGQHKEINKNETTVLQSAGIEVDKTTDKLTEKPIENRDDLLKKLENPDKNSITAQKLVAPFHMPTSTTEHNMDNLATIAAESAENTMSQGIDPYREMPE